MPLLASINILLNETGLDSLTLSSLLYSSCFPALILTRKVKIDETPQKIKYKTQCIFRKTIPTYEQGTFKIM